MNIVKKHTIFATVKNVYDEDEKKGKYSRGKSWEHCYEYFQAWHKSGFKEEEKQPYNYNDKTASLLLAFYLASWGMYRGSSHLLRETTHTVFIPIIGILKDKKYEALWDFQMEENSANLIFDLKDKLVSEFKGDELNFDQKSFGTLVSKILMGTMGCTPAYDGIFKEGLKHSEISPYSNYSLRSLKAVIRFYKDNENEFIKAHEYVNNSRSGFMYPMAKIVDRYFYKIGQDS